MTKMIALVRDRGLWITNFREPEKFTCSVSFDSSIAIACLPSLKHFKKGLG
jgi:hypothetical protein